MLHSVNAATLALKMLPSRMPNSRLIELKINPSRKTIARSENRLIPSVPVSIMSEHTPITIVSSRETTPPHRNLAA